MPFVYGFLIFSTIIQGQDKQQRLKINHYPIVKKQQQQKKYFQRGFYFRLQDAGKP